MKKRLTLTNLKYLVSKNQSELKKNQRDAKTSTV